VGGPDVSLDAAPFDDDHADLDVGIDFCAVTDDQGVVAADLAPKAAVDAQAALEMEFPFEMRTSAEKRGDFGRG
jgi:hypothetical protein